MQYIYEIELEDIKKEELEKMIKWLDKNKIENVKTNKKLLIKFNDYYIVYRFDKVIKSLRAGFKFEEAIKIITNDWEFIEIDIKKAAEKKDNHKIRILGRIIGEDGKALKKLEEITKAKILVSDRYVYILGDNISIQTAFETIRRIVRGTPHSSAYDIASNLRRHLKNKEKEVNYFINL